MNLPLPTQLTLSTPTFLIPPHIPTHIITFHITNTNQTHSKNICKEFFGEELSIFAAANPTLPFTTSLTKIRGKRG